ncbi:MAG: collagen-like protein [Clostridia bacterium]|nr:collagen-like protein [Clostridia bacterium]
MNIPHFMNTCGCNDSCGCQRHNCSDCYYRYQGGQRGARGPMGPVGPVGPQGPQGIAGGLIAYADFYALMPTDNATPIAAGADVAFPRTAINGGTGITRTSDTAFTLATPGTYMVTYNAAIGDAGQLVLTLNGAEIPYTVVGKDTAGDQLSGTFLITTIAPNSVITLRNPATSTTTVTLTASAGGVNPVAANMVITRVA